MRVPGVGGGGGGGGGSGPASTVHQKKISGVSSTPQKIEILATKKIFPMLYLDL